MSNPLFISWLRPVALDHPEEVKAWKIGEGNDFGKYTTVVYGASSERGEFLKKAFLACYNPAGYDSYVEDVVVKGEKGIIFVRWSCE